MSDHASPRRIEPSADPELFSTLLLFAGPCLAFVLALFLVQ